MNNYKDVSKGNITELHTNTHVGSEVVVAIFSGDDTVKSLGILADAFQKNTTKKKILLGAGFKVSDIIHFSSEMDVVYVTDMCEKLKYIDEGRTTKLELEHIRNTFKNNDCKLIYDYGSNYTNEARNKWVIQTADKVLLVNDLDDVRILKSRYVNGW